MFGPLCRCLANKDLFNNSSVLTHNSLFRCFSQFNCAVALESEVGICNCPIDGMAGDVDMFFA